MVPRSILLSYFIVKPPNSRTRVPNILLPVCGWPRKEGESVGFTLAIHIEVACCPSKFFFHVAAGGTRSAKEGPATIPSTPDSDIQKQTQDGTSMKIPAEPPAPCWTSRGRSIQPLALKNRDCAYSSGKLRAPMSSL